MRDALVTLDVTDCPDLAPILMAAGAAMRGVVLTGTRRLAIKESDRGAAMAEELSKPFPFVRVDFYECDGKVVFGEFTFTPTGCLGTYYTEEAQIEYGKKLRVK